MSVGQFRLSRARGDLILQKTQLGWVVVGGIDSEESKEKTALFATTELRDQLERFWLIEDAIVTRTEGTQEVECETHYTQNTKCDETGRYIVRLPFREKGHDYSDLYHIALRRFHNLWKKLNANPELRKAYERTMQEYLTLGHMSLVEDDPTGGCYLPHHAVIKSTSTTTKVRVVFDASAKNNQGISLNSTLLVGPTIQDTLVEHLLRFRTYRYVLTADIEKMYRQIWIHPDDRQYQRIFWIHKDRIRTFELNTVTFGIASAPFLAIRTIKQLAKDESVNYPLGAEILNRDLYVDDLITGTDDVETLGRIRDQTIEILKRGGFNIRQWASNYRPILDKLDTKKVNVEFFSGETSILKTLGISWNTHHDHLIYTVAPIDLHEKITKRRILSEIAKIYDPLGLLGPIILTAKILIQDCWKTKVEWDESVPNALHSSWTRFAEQLKVRKIVRHCVCCIRFRASGIQYKMGDLPRSRVQETIAFSHTGVDFFGPLYVKEKKYRNKGRVKVYGCIFVCMCIKAVHIELVSDLTTDAFLAAFRRFTGRRAIPSHVYSDNGTNFVGANNQLRELYALIESEEFKTKLHNYATDQKNLVALQPPIITSFQGSMGGRG
ncbi:uncharacterized protein LOC122521989 [Polistes fuscatus]|uniref:uncharacterized protein LOC122521989 n=1 Tax=Polistes fuscatus TaxID=30207 RepID=UPI001CA80AD6|nr:uncharacterized protein LOC122521989 [Polistes fuscatus]